MLKMQKTYTSDITDFLMTKNNNYFKNWLLKTFKELLLLKRRKAIKNFRFVANGNLKGYRVVNGIYVHPSENSLCT